MRVTLLVLVALPVLGFTLPSAAVAGGSLGLTSDTSVRTGTAVGFTQFGDDRVSTLGGQIAIGKKWGPVGVEAEYDRLVLLEYHGGSNQSRGDMSRLGLNGRLYLGQLGRKFDPTSLFHVFVEAGVGRQSGRYSTSDTFRRHDVSVGGGFLLEHRRSRRESRGVSSIGWHFGWRLMGSPRAQQGPAFFASCRSKGDPCPSRVQLGPGHDLGLMVSSSLSFRW